MAQRACCCFGIGVVVVLTGCSSQAAAPCDDSFMGSHSTEITALELANTDDSDDDWVASERRHDRRLRQRSLLSFGRLGYALQVRGGPGSLC